MTSTKHHRRGKALIYSCALVLAMTVINLQAAESSPKPPVIFNADFENADGLSGWSGKATLAEGYSGRAGCLIQSAPETPGATISYRLPAESIRGYVLRGSAMVRAEEVSAKPNSWNGIKFMLVIETPDGRSYPQAALESGTFAWRRAGLRVAVPLEATNVTLVLGLEQVNGRVWFDDVRLTTEKPHREIPGPVAGPMYKGHRLPRLRGAMVSPGIDAASLRVLGGDWNANLIRYQLIRTGRTPRFESPEGYDTWIEGELKRLDALLPVCEELGVLVALDLHSPPGGKPTAGGYYGSDAGLFTSKAAQDRFVNLWREIALRYQAAKAIWAFDLANEPVEDDVADDCDTWQELAEKAARAIRAIDPQRTIIVEPSNWGSPDGLRTFLPLPVSNVVYSVHMYVPHQFTHQNVHARGPECGYPGMIAGKFWDKAELEKALQPAIDFQRRFNVHIYIGEFSAIRWAPDHSAYRYLSDVIEIFEKHNWDWSYHAFREWQGWSVEHGPNQADTQPSPTPTERQTLLREWFAKNQKPERN